MPSPAADAALSAQLRMSVMRLARRLRAQRTDASLELTLTQLAALATIHLSGPLTLRELADAERVQPPSMTKVVALLETRGLVVREAHPTDGRQVLLSVSPPGKALLHEDRRRRDVWLFQRLRTLTPDEVAVLRQAAPILERLART